MTRFVVKSFDRNPRMYEIHGKHKLKLTFAVQVIVLCKHYTKLSHLTRTFSQYTYNFFATVFATEAELIYMTDSCLLPFPMSDPLEWHETTQVWIIRALPSAGKLGQNLRLASRFSSPLQINVSLYGKSHSGCCYWKETDELLRTTRLTRSLMLTIYQPTALTTTTNQSSVEHG